jgi:hypothetical protein
MCPACRFSSLKTLLVSTLLIFLLATMPKDSSHRTAGQISPCQESVSSPSHPRTANPIDHPLASADPDLNGSIVNMHNQNEERLRDALYLIAAPRPTDQEPHHAGHAISHPKLSFGMDNPARAGSWYQTVCTLFILFALADDCVFL